MPAIDEFGGYSSRLRIPDIVSAPESNSEKEVVTVVEAKKNKKSAKKNKIVVEESVAISSSC